MSFLVTILASKSNNYGLAKDVEVLRRAFASNRYSVRHCDPLEPPSYSDLTIHLEVPIFGWAAWSAKNCLVVNPELYNATAWNSYLDRFDYVVVKDRTALNDFRTDKTVFIPWAIPESPLPMKMRKDAFLWVLGASKNKRAYVPTLLSAWRPSYPPLLITSVAELDLSGVRVLPNVSIRIGDLTEAEQKGLRAEHRGHICCSRAEGFGYTAAEAYSAGAFVILNSLPCYKDIYENCPTVYFVPSKIEQKYFDVGVDTDILQSTLNDIMNTFVKNEAQHILLGISERWTTFQNAWRKLVPITKRPATLKYLPPKLDVASCPPISVVTLVYNRKKFFDLACHSMMITDYPKDKIEWVVVDDSDDPTEQNSDRIVAVGNAAAPMKFVYVPLKHKTVVSEKRNLGVTATTNPIVLFVDDDDHYPETSFRRRVAWLTLHPWSPKCVASTTIACYDLLKGISAVNVPPNDIPFSQRVSEATLTFYRTFWEEKGFPKDILVGEGEGFLQGREEMCLEIPPQQIIVAFSHGKNVSSRRIPSDADVKPGCFWGFPKDFLVFIHGLAGVTVTSSTKD